MKMLARAALLLSAVPAYAAPVPSPSASGDPGVYQVGVTKVPAFVSVNSSGDEVGGATAYTEDAAAAANPVGTMGLCVRRDTVSAAQVSANGDNVAFGCTDEGEIYFKAIDTDAKLDTLITSIAALYETIGDQADAAATSGASSLMGYTRASRDALHDTTTASLVKISQSTTENDVDVATIAAGSNLIGKVDANIAINAPVRIVSAAGVTEDETQVCAAACTVLRVSGYNAAAGTRYIKFTNLTAANTTPGTSTVYWSIPIPATSPFSIPVEQYFSTAATVYLVTGSADNDVAEVTAGDILGLAITTK